MWWAYVKEPTRLKALALGAWVAAAFYWRADHGVFISGGRSGDGMRSRRQPAGNNQACGGSRSVATCGLAGSDSRGVNSGPSVLLTNGAAIVNAQHTATSSHTWPKWPIRGVRDVIRLDGPEEFAPVVGLRWTEDSSAEARAAVLAKYGLTPLSDDGPQVQVVRMSEQSSGAVRGLINEPIVADTNGIDLERTQNSHGPTFPLWQRLRFSRWWLRFRVFTGVNEHGNAGEAVAAIFYTLPLIVILAAAPWLHRYLRPRA